ncbi:TatD family hydrolase [Thalassotalea profundi]|uniref:3'-5' ssDNA/RNA exonuclease TatD n=1 Tax=Thalassotalea profundi TaxID=2036687 RepID=A0ABQ3IVN4_9GAMM|nr:TatD family hydrolase [Thalassotalea profundi]GHE95607.1 3'-5' ssDNA/RNA exonuclease TatD [Thalassotalea profundi]
MIDIGVNFTNSRFDKDRSLVIERAEAEQVTGMLVTGTSVAESQKALALCAQFPKFLHCTVGVHPHDADSVSANYIEALIQLSESVHVKAIGECGLDYNRNFSTPENQVQVFRQQVSLANQLSLPLFLHQRDAFEQWFAILRPYLDKVPAMVSHCFTGNKKELMTCLDAGMYIGITGWLCDERRGQELQEIVRHIPLSQLMIETDAPYLTPRNIKPRPKSSRNEPCYLPIIVKKLAELTGYSEEEIQHHTKQNTEKVFNWNAAI